MLCVPAVGRFETVGRRILVAWNVSREATRAVHDALPFLCRAEHVRLVNTSKNCVLSVDFDTRG